MSEFLIITGVSGAGGSTAGDTFEDLGWFVVDNLPPELITTMVDLGSRASGDVTRIAIVLDVRSRLFTEDLAAVIRDLDARGYRPRVLFLEASDAALIRRYEANRRSHPLQEGGRLADGVAAERAVLEPLRQEADVVVDTSELSVHQLRAEVERVRAARGTDTSRVVPSAVRAARRDGIAYDEIPAPLADRAIEPGDAGYAAVRSNYLRGGSPGLVLRPLAADA